MGVKIAKDDCEKQATSEPSLKTTENEKGSAVATPPSVGLQLSLEEFY